MASKVTYKIGDIVRLKSGGPSMTITQVHEPGPLDRIPTVNTSWFGGKKLENGHFPFDAIELVPAGSEGKA